MIGSLRGVVLNRTPGQVLLEVGGIGYEIAMTQGAYDRMPDPQGEALLYISESTAMYGGGTSLYGFLTLEEKDIFNLLREIPGTGAKKALEYLDKIAASAPDFRRCVVEADARALTSLFGFSKKTAEKIIVSLKDRIAGLRLAGREKFSAAVVTPGIREALAALVSLGYREGEARTALDRLPSGVRAEPDSARLVREALKQLS